MIDVAGWLAELGLQQYVRLFVENDIDEQLLIALSADDLKELGVASLGHRRRLLEAIEALRSTSASASRPAAADSPAMAFGERRQVTVLFADLAGYTKLTTELDAEEVHALLGAFFALVDRIIVDHGGHVDKHIGDCVMAVFGAPVAYGNDTARAVSAALAIRDAMPDLAIALGRAIGVHVGIAGGQVVASGIGSSTHHEYTVTGDTVNLASRLTDAAAAGEILISAMVHREVVHQLSAEEAGDITVKGFVEPVRAWRVTGMHAPTPIRGPLVGRGNELRQLVAALGSCRETGQGQAIFVRGDAGIGKTRLVEEVQRAAVELGFACHLGLVLDFGAGSGRDAIRALFRSLLDLDAASDRDATTAAVDRALRAGLATADDIVFLNDLLDLPQPLELRSLYEAMNNAHRNEGKRRVVARLVERASQQQPRLLVVEDLHWSEPLTLAHLARLSAAVAECPAILVMTSRKEGDPLDHSWRTEAGDIGLTTIDLGPLRVEEARTIASSFLAMSAVFAERCVERAAGNPLFLDQLLRHAAESREAEAIPASVQSLVQARLDRLDPADKEALQAASVLGQRFDRDALRHLFPRSDVAAERLTARSLLRPLAGGAFLFAHALVRDAVYETMLKSRRRLLHAAAAAWYTGRDAVLRAEHLDRGESPDAAAAYLEAAQAQAAQYRYENARRLAECGLALAREPAELFGLVCFKGEILHDLGAMAEAKEAYELALAKAQGDADRCQAWLGLAACKRVTDDLAGAEADLARAEATSTPLDLTAVLARVHFLSGNICFPRGDIEGCVSHHRQSLDFARQAGSAQHEAAALGGLGDAEYVRGRMTSAHGRYEECIALCRQHALGRIEAAHRQMLGLTRFFRNDVRGALVDALAAADAARRIGHQRAELIAHVIAAEMFANLVELAEANAHLEVTAPLIQQLGALRFEPPRLNCLAKVRRAEGRRAEALSLLERSLAVSRETSLAFSGPSVLGALALTTDDATARKRAIDEGESLLRAGSVAHNHFRFYRDSIDATLLAGEWDEAERLATALEAFTASEPLPWTDFYIGRGRALAAWGRGQRGHAILDLVRGLATEARRAGLLLALPALEGALGPG